MKKMRIIDIQNCEYILLDEDNVKYKGTFEFIDVKDPPIVGDYILWATDNCTNVGECLIINNEHILLRRAYGPRTQIGYMRQGYNITNDDVLIVLKPTNTYLLHRYYG